MWNIVLQNQHLHEHQQSFDLYRVNGKHIPRIYQCAPFWPFALRILRCKSFSLVYYRSLLVFPLITGSSHSPWVCKALETVQSLVGHLYRLCYQLQITSSARSHTLPYSFRLLQESWILDRFAPDGQAIQLTHDLVEMLLFSWLSNCTSRRGIEASNYPCNQDDYQNSQGSYRAPYHVDHLHRIALPALGSILEE